jgi:hypothetical protein
MPRLIEMGTLTTRSKRRADKEFDEHIPAAEWLALINEVWAADIFGVVAACGLRYFETTSDLTTTGVAYVSEPSNHLSTIRLDYVDSSGRLHELDEVNSEEEGFLTGVTSSGRAHYFTLLDSRIYLYPTPPTGQTYRIAYIPQAPDVSGFASDECVDVVNADGEACLYWGVAALVKVKAQQDASVYMQKHAEYRDRLEKWAIDRSLTQPRRRPAADEYSERGFFDPGDYR